MTDITEDLVGLIGTLRELFDHDNCHPECEILSAAQVSIEQTGYDNWDGGTSIYGLYLEVPTGVYAIYETNLKAIEDAITEKLRPILRRYPGTWIGEVVITPSLASSQMHREQPAYRIPEKDLLHALEAQRHLMISVSTGGPRIQSVNAEYIERQHEIEEGLSERGVENPNPYSDLWDWYAKWSSGDLPSYQSRRTYIAGLFDPLTHQLRQHMQVPELTISTRPTGWTRVDRCIGEARTRLSQAKTEEQFQAVGLLCREAMISLGQAVYNPETHPSSDGTIPSKTDAKRMLDAYLAATLSGETNEPARRHAKAALDFANALIHKRTADFRQAAMCAEATTAIVNIVAVISGQRDPQE